MSSPVADYLARPAINAPVVLVVEDEVLVRDLAADYLRDSGFMVIEAADAREALVVLTSGFPIDLVCTDLQMPGEIDGAALAKWVRDRHGAPVLLTSGHPDAVETEGVSYLPKPYFLGDLVRRIGELLAADGFDGEVSPSRA
jgi:CheY-like chemotaxis protein